MQNEEFRRVVEEGSGTMRCNVCKMKEFRSVEGSGTHPGFQRGCWDKSRSV